MKTRLKLNWLVVLVIALSGLLPAARAFYAPAEQRWLNRDPLKEPGFEVLRGKAESSAGDVSGNGPNQFLFVHNNSISKTDALGLFDGNSDNRHWKIDPPKWPSPWKSCGVLVTRATFPSSSWYRWPDNFLTSTITPHMFLILPDGRRLSNGGDANNEDHWSSYQYPISIPSDASCQEFTKCLKDYFNSEAAKGYSLMGNNCHLASKAVKHCGGSALP